MSDNEIEDVSFLPGGHSSNKKVVYDPNNLQRCQQLVLSRNRAILVISVLVGTFVVVALIAAFARTGTPPCGDRLASPLTDDAETGAKPAKAFATNGQPFPWNNIRLPESVVPLKYELSMWPNLTTFRFDGNVSVVIDVRSSTDFIVFHSKELTIRSCTVAKMKSQNSLGLSVAVLQMLEYTRNEQIFLKLDSSLMPGEKYMLIIDFNGTLTDNLAGFYRSSYDTSTGGKQWLATTHFEPTDARAAFPCFDEPQLKANFTLSIVREPHQVALFNTEKIGDDKIDGGRLFVDHFATTVKMSTYLVAFVVCDFQRKSKFTTSGIQVSVYAPAELIDQTTFALDVATSVLEFYEDFYGIKYPLNKSDHIAIPDFAAGAMENWGLVTYLMRALLYNPRESSANDQQWVAVVVAHELAHQWFGNLVTMKWWNDLWLNEGFARFVECLGTDHVKPEYRMTEIFVDDALSAALYSDALASSHPISVPVYDPTEIGEIFDTISYEKGASVIRMLESFLGSTTFIGGLRRYLQRHQYGNAETDDLWTSMTEEGRLSGSDIKVKDIMDTWTLQMGYPVVTIKRRGRNVDASQERFLFNARANLSEEFTSPYGYKWYVPLTYVTSNEPRKHSPVVWMQKSGASFLLDSTENIGWIKVNANMTGVYRVHYEEDNWKALINQLRTDHSVFTVSDRTNLISDAFALARSGQLDISLALELSLYLVNEDEYVPWQIALASLGYIGELLEAHPDYVYFRDFMRHLTANIRKRLTWEDSGSHLTKLLRASILTDSVDRGDPESIKQVKEMFSDWSQNNISVSPNLKSVVYVGGVKYGGEPEWQFIFRKYEQTQTPSEKSKLLASLAASTDVMILNRFLKMAINESIIRSSETTSVLSVVAANPYGRVLTWRFVRANWKLLYARYHNVMMKMRRIILGVCGHFTTQFDFDEVKAFFKTNLRGENIRAVSQALEKISMNIDWLSRNERKVFDWLRNNRFD